MPSMDVTIARMNKTYEYRGRQVSITAFQKVNEPEVWDMQIRVDGILQVLNSYEQYKPKLFSSPEDAITYGEEAAEHLVDTR